MPAPKNNLQTSDYTKLFNAIARLYDQGLKDVAAAAESIFTKIYREAGRLIVEDEQDGKKRAPYGDHLLEDLAKELTESGRKGFSVRNLYYMRNVALAFPILQISAELSWSHLVLLSSIKDEKERKVYAQKTVEKKWNVAQLKDAIRDIAVIEIAPAPKLLGSSSDDSSKKTYKIPLKRGLLYTYRVVDQEHAVPKADHASVDVGFFSYRHLALGRHKRLTPCEIITATGGVAGGDAFERCADKTINRSVLYTFSAYVKRLPDVD